MRIEFPSALLLATLMFTGPASAEFQIVKKGIDLAPFPAPPPVAVGYTWKAVKQDGTAYEWKVTSVAGDTRTSRDSDGCQWTGKHGMMRPSSSWVSCGGNTGTASIYVEKEPQFPLKVGSRWSYEVNGGSWRTDRDCEIEDAARVRIALGEYDTFKIVCEDRWNVRTYYFEPSLNKSVYYERRRLNEATTESRELVAE